MAYIGSLEWIKNSTDGCFRLHILYVPITHYIIPYMYLTIRGII